MPLIASGNILISKTVGVIACTAIGSIVGAGLGVKFLRYKLQQKKSELEKPYRDSLSSYVLMPDDLLRFWESRVEIFLRERKSRVQSRIREASRTKAECIKIIEELKELKKTHDPTTENKLLYQVKNMAAVVEEAQKVNAILQKLEDKFAAKIEELRVLVTKQKKYERDQYRLQEIEGKVKRIVVNHKKLKMIGVRRNLNCKFKFRNDECFSKSTTSHQRLYKSRNYFKQSFRIGNRKRT